LGARVRVREVVPDAAARAGDERDLPVEVEARVLHRQSFSPEQACFQATFSIADDGSSSIRSRTASSIAPWKEGWPRAGRSDARALLALVLAAACALRQVGKQQGTGFP
jgi:hypothetical protein